MFIPLWALAVVALIIIVLFRDSYQAQRRSQEKHHELIQLRQQYEKCYREGYHAEQERSRLLGEVNTLRRELQDARRDAGR